MNIQAVPFKGAYFMCVEGSPRAHVLKAANYAFELGKPELAEAIRREALELDGCAFEARGRGARLVQRFDDGLSSDAIFAMALAKMVEESLDDD